MGKKVMTGYQTIRSIAVRFRDDESGATAIEYAIIAAGVGGFLAATIMTLGATVKSTFYDKLASLFP
jgi:pilus assembly protein Flp/PilA